nr:hypothetical protein [Helicobacter sp. UBA3407]
MRFWNNFICGGGGDFPLKIAFYLLCAGIGDAMVILKSLYAAKFLYPKATLSLIVKFNTSKNLFRNMEWIDEIVSFDEVLQDKTRKFDVVLLLLQHDNLKAIWEVKRIPTKRILTTFSKNLLLHKRMLFIPQVEQVINPYWRQNRAFMEGSLNLVRAINKKHFDKEIPKIDYSKALLKREEENIIFVDSILEKLEACKYAKIIGVNPFCVTLKNAGKNFSFSTWFRIAENLAKEFPQFLFIFMDYPKSGVQFPKMEQENLKIFKNNQDLLNLVEFISRLDCLLSSNTGNVHNADNLKIPTLELIRESAQNRWQGGGWGGIYENVIVPTSWQTREKEFAEIFLQRAKDFLIQNLA